MYQRLTKQTKLCSIFKLPKNNFEINFKSAIDKTNKEMKSKYIDVKDLINYAQKDVTHSYFCFVCSKMYYVTNQNDIIIEEFEHLKKMGNDFQIKHNILNKYINLYIRSL